MHLIFPSSEMRYLRHHPHHHLHRRRFILVITRTYHQSPQHMHHHDPASSIQHQFNFFPLRLHYA